MTSPAYYTRGGIEALTVIQAWELNFLLGSAVKYIARAGHKTGDAVPDLRKAIHCLEREVSRLENRK